MKTESARGAFVPGLTAPRADSRVNDLITRSAEDPLSRKNIGTPSDSLRSLTLQTGALGSQGSCVIGLVTLAVPHLNWYRVQTADGHGVIECRRVLQDGSVPLGAQTVSPIPPNSAVLVFVDSNIDYGLILGIIPLPKSADNPYTPGYVSQGSGAGVQRDAVHNGGLQFTFAGGGMQNYSGGTPLDATNFSWGKLFETGVGLYANSFMAQLLASPFSGIFASLLDHYCRVMGLNYDLWTGSQAHRTRIDEGEVRSVTRHYVYPWEAVGLYAPGGSVGQTNRAEDVQFRKPVASVDLADADMDVEPVARRIEYGGYEGQGGFRAVVRPAGESGKRHRQDSAGDYGLFCESIGLDGAMLMQSAKSLSFVKRLGITVPREKKVPEDNTGDNKNGYKASGKTGSGGEHKIGDVKVEGDKKSALRAAGVLDILAHAFNWKALHPFAYHTLDYTTPQDGALPKFDSAMETLNYSELSSKTTLPDPEPVALKIDHRYGDVDYFKRMSFFTFTDDGSVILSCGSGSQIIMSQGGIAIDAPGLLRVSSGSTVLLQGRDLVMKGNGSVDITSSQKEIRLAAKEKIQVTSDSLFVETTGTDRQYEYENKIGEDVKSTGIVLKTATNMVVLADDVYVRSGVGDGGGTGEITIDASKREKAVNIAASDVNVFTKEGCKLWHGTPDQTPTATHTFTPNESILSTPVTVNGKMTVVGRDADVTVDGRITCTGDVASGGNVASKSGGMLSKIPTEFTAQIKQAVQSKRAIIQQTLEDGKLRELTKYKTQWYLPTKPGSDSLIKLLAFSFRDDDDNKQYKCKDLVFLEPYWQQLVRIGIASGGESWTEMSVSYQGKQLYPWPGRKNWDEEECFHQLESLKLFSASGKANERPGEFEEAKLATLAKKKMSESIKIFN